MAPLNTLVPNRRAIYTTNSVYHICATLQLVAWPRKLRAHASTHMARWPSSRPITADMLPFVPSAAPDSSADGVAAPGWSMGSWFATRNALLNRILHSPALSRQ